jgi:ADP-ribose pyrophosphatase
MSEKVYRGRLVDVELRDGKEVVVHGPAVAVVAVDGDDRVVLVRQERPGAGGKLVEIPAGNVDEGEAPLASAQRELREETGLHGGQWTELARFYTSPGFCDERMHLFAARDVMEGEAEPDASEELEVLRVPLSEVPELVAHLEDAKTLTGLMLLLRTLDGPAEGPPDMVAPP